jgi:hypothetical protein
MRKRLFLLLLAIFNINNNFAQDYCNCFTAKISTIASNQSSISWYFDIFNGDPLCTPISPTNAILVSWETSGQSFYYSDSIWWHNITTPSVFPNGLFTTMSVTVTDLSIDGSIFSCDYCYTTMWDGVEWGVEQVDCTILSVHEIKTPHLSKKYYNILGKEFNNFNSIPIGSIYINNKKQYLKSN